MVVHFLNRYSLQKQTLLYLSTVRHRNLYSFSTSELHQKYAFKPPSSLERNPNPCSSKPQTHSKLKEKPPYKPPSLLDLSNKKPLRSILPFNFSFFYTESSPNVRPIAPKLGKETAEVEERRKMRERIQGEELNSDEMKVIVENCHRKKTNTQINLGRDGLTRNIMNDIHYNWKLAEAVRIKCTGVPTVDMENLCTQLEDKSFGKVVHRHGDLLILYRGRNYDPKKRPVIPLMLWKPHEPIYPRLIKTRIEGLSIWKTKKLRKKGLTIHPLVKLAKNGNYGCLVPMVRDGFLLHEVVRIDCQSLAKNDYEKLGCRLRIPTKSTHPSSNDLQYVGRKDIFVGLVASPSRLGI